MKVSFQMTLDGMIRALRGRMLQAVADAEDGERREPVAGNRGGVSEPEGRAADERGR